MKAVSSKDAVQTTRLLTLQDVCARTTLTKPVIYELIRADDFPVPVQISRRRIAWIESDVAKWIESREKVSWAA